SYMFSGFFIGNAQHIWWLINATWLPFAFLYLLRLYKDPGFTDALKLGFIFFLMLSGGYPGLFIVTVYLFLVAFFVLVIKYMKERNYAGIRKFLSFISIAIFIFVLTSLVVLVSAFDFSDFINRGTALPYDKGGVLSGAFSSRALLSILFSYPASINNVAFWGSDFSMVNTFFGFFILIILIFFLISGKAPKQSIYFSAVAIFFLMLAMAEVFPFRRWLYLYVPFMDMFRFSSLFRLFAIFFFILAAGFSIEKLISHLKPGKQFLKYIWITGVLLAVFLIIMSFNIERWMFKALFTDGFPYFDSIAGIGEKVFFQGAILLGLISVFLLFLWRKREWGRPVLVLVIFAEMIISVQLNINATVVNPYAPEYIESHLDKLPAGFPIPSLNDNMRSTNDTTMGKNLPYLWRNLGELYKMPSGSSFSPYKLNTVQTAVRNNTIEAVIGQPLVFLAKSLTQAGLVDTSTILKAEPGSIQITGFDPGRIELKACTDTTLFLVLLQNLYPYWHVTVDNTEQEIIPVNDTFMAVRLPEGDHHLMFEFHSKRIVFVFWISLICWILCLSVIIISWLKRPEPGLSLYLKLMLLIPAFLLLSILIINNRQRYRLPKKMIPSLVDFASGLSNDSVKVVLNIDNPSEFPSAFIHRACVLRLQQRNDLSELQRWLMQMDSEYVLFAQMNTPFIPETEWLISQYYPKEIIRRKFGTGFYALRKKGIAEDEPITFSSVNDFETPVPGWSDSGTGLDSMVIYSGRYSNKLDSINIYSSTYTTRITNLPKPGRKYFRITLQARPGPGADPLIVFEV
ncbi:MAG TPA: hypothetical protein VJ346_04185, partial [Bacteroidales bacterium]|nr:hypothetical protein [Bacteroidales bacterium]